MPGPVVQGVDDRVDGLSGGIAIAVNVASARMFATDRHILEVSGIQLAVWRN